MRTAQLIRKNNKNRVPIMKQLLISLMLTIGISSVTFAMMANHDNGFDWHQLELTETQDQLIASIRESYFEQLKVLRLQNMEAGDKKQQMAIIKNEMIAEIKNLLTTQQKQKASEIIVAEMKGRIDKRLSFLITELNLSEEQEKGLKYVLTMQFSELGERKRINEIPDFNDRQQMLDHLDAILPKMLSMTQLVQWEIIKEKRMQYAKAQNMRGSKYRLVG